MAFKSNICSTSLTLFLNIGQKVTEGNLSKVLSFLMMLIDVCSLLNLLTKAHMCA